MGEAHYSDKYADPNEAAYLQRTAIRSKPAAGWHPTTIAEDESPFRLGFCLPQRTYTLFRHGDYRDLSCRILQDEVRLGCTYIDNSAIREMYWWSNAAPKSIRWAVRMWVAWQRRPR